MPSLSERTALHAAIEKDVAQPGSLSHAEAMTLSKNAANQAQDGTRKLVLAAIRDAHFTRNLSFSFANGLIPVISLDSVKIKPRTQAYGLRARDLGILNSKDQVSSESKSQSLRRLHAPVIKSGRPPKPHIGVVLQGIPKFGVEEQLQEGEMEHLGGVQCGEELGTTFFIVDFPPPRSSSALICNSRVSWMTECCVWVSLVALVLFVVFMDLCH